jgi:hypothetical protein
MSQQQTEIHGSLCSAQLAHAAKHVDVQVFNGMWYNVQPRMESFEVVEATNPTFEVLYD